MAPCSLRHGEVVEGEHVAGVDGRHDQRPAAVGEADRDRAVAAQDRGLDERDRGRVDRRDAEVDVVDAEALGDRAGVLVGGDDVGLQQRLSGRLTGRARQLDGALDRLPAREAEFDDRVADPARLAAPPRRRREAGRGLGGARCGRRAAHLGDIGSRAALLKSRLRGPAELPWGLTPNKTPHAPRAGGPWPGPG